MTRRPRLSQNFLADRTMALALVERLALAPDDVVIEIGAGRGAISGDIADRVHRLVAIEIDPELAAPLARRLPPPRVEVVTGDVLDLDLDRLVAGTRPRIVGNIPYHISSPLVLKLLEARAPFVDATLLVQREFAIRLEAAPGGHDYGSLTVLAAARVAVKGLLDIGPAAFHPRPRVWSRLVRLTPLACPLASGTSWAALKTVLRAGFSGRRKGLAKALAHGLAVPRPEVEQALHAIGLSPLDRAEVVPPATWARIAAWYLACRNRAGAGGSGGAGPAF